MEITLSCYSSPGHRIAIKSFTCQDSCVVMTCVKFCSNCFVTILIIAEQFFHQIKIMLEKLLVKCTQANCQARSAMNIYLHVKQTSEGVMFVSFIFQLFTWLMQHKGSISYFPWKLFWGPFHRWRFNFYHQLWANYMLLLFNSIQEDCYQIYLSV